jgi:hypothetical protein
MNLTNKLLYLFRETIMKKNEQQIAKDVIKDIKDPDFKAEADISSEMPQSQSTMQKSSNLKLKGFVEKRLAKCGLAKAMVASDIEKSNYKGYTATDNMRRKANNTGSTPVKGMPRIKAWGGIGGPVKAKEEQKKINSFNRKSPVKEYSKEEIAKLNDVKKQEQIDGMPIDLKKELKLKTWIENRKNKGLK